MAETGSSNTRRIRRLARERFGFDSLRPGQEEAIASLLEGRDTLAVMPTGSGKSAVYQLAAQLLPGAAVIISPLIALQRDQVASIEEHDLGEAAEVNSTLGEGEREDVLEDLAGRELKFLFLAPEQFNRAETLQDLRDARPSLFVVDEAHAISEWGHDFRPEYLRLGAVIEELGHPVVLALTATAAPPVREEIVERLGMRDPTVVVRGFDRPNIWLGVEKFHDERTKRERLLEAAIEAQKPGIVYAATHRHVDEVTEALVDRGARAAGYHAGMSSRQREAAQDAFMSGEAEVIVATTAFGMGIDKPDVRFVFHHDISDSVDSYYQEIGRAGRDGAPARAVLFYRPEDLHLRRFFAAGARVDAEQMEEVIRTVEESAEPIDAAEIAEETGLSERKVITALTNLEDVGAVATLATGEVVDTDNGSQDLVDEAVEAVEHHRAFDASRVEMMRGYAELYDCRREYLLNYFGEEYDDPCHYCDNCDAGRTVPEDEQNAPFPLNSRVRHGVWGEGLVQRYEGDAVVVLFDTVGYKMLDLGFVLESGALQSV